MIKRLKRFWSEEHSLSVLLFFLVVEMVLLFPLSRTGRLLGVVNGAVFSVLLLAGLLTVSRRKLVQGLCASFIGVAIVVRWLRLAGVAGLLSWDTLFSALSVAGLVGVVLWAVYREGPITGHRIRGAIVVYLLLALFFAYVYGFIEIMHAGSFRLPEGEPSARLEPLQDFLYFSVVTITTLGYGDITPIDPWARAVVIMEAVIGPLYLTILLARLVTLQLEAKK
jgi:hypothetical protein